MLGNRRKSINFALSQWNNGEEHWNSVVCNSWTTDMTTLQYSENYLVTTTYPGFSGVTGQNGKSPQSTEITWFSVLFFFAKISDPRIIQCVIRRYFFNAYNRCLKFVRSFTGRHDGRKRDVRLLPEKNTTDHRELWRFFQVNATEYPVPACSSTPSEQTLNPDYNPR